MADTVAWHSRVYGIDEDTELSDELAAIVRVAVEKPFAEVMRYLENAYKNSERTVHALYRVHNDPQYLALDHAIYLSMNYPGTELVYPDHGRAT